QAQRTLTKGESTIPAPPRLSFWNIREYLPRETRNYVPLYIATTLISLNPQAYGFTPDGLAYETEYIYDVYNLPEPINLNAVARCLGISTDSLRQLNPELLTLSTPPDMIPYPLKIPIGSRELLAQCLLTLSPADKQPWIVHTTRRRETLADIAARYGIPISEIRRVNRVGKRLRPGTKLRIPLGTAALISLDTLPVPPPAGIGAVEQVERPRTQSVRYHIVRRGQTLAEIAARYEVTVAELKQWNRLRTDRIRVGQRLRVYLPVTSGSYALHNVQRGETAYGIAQKYGVTVEELQRWNPDILQDGTLQAGVSLRIYRSPSASQQKLARRTVRTYRVRAGDTLLSIARRFGVSVNELRAHNELNGDHIRVGQQLRIPQ
ncbi:MAG: LysM peptidoglycan-binding domain-containing protein, partial [Candidatus Kapabacteria bacterium]|nr:LysM peptidoglycan-binding domain-containing protein [Candidatus Kapabacteria bacterium]MDW7997153.1 LysM peptidoglycan-binding domain-containing protein [Bacteroidota bacterium]